MKNYIIILCLTLAACTSNDSPEMLEKKAGFWEWVANQMDEDSQEDPEPAATATPEPAATATPEPSDDYFSWPTNYTDRSYTFYWKAQAHSRPHAVVLLSSKQWGKVRKIELWHNGQLLERVSYHVSTKDGKPNPGVNGNRPHFYLRKLGKDYPSGVIVRQLLDDGGYEDIPVPAPSGNYKKSDQ